MTPATAPIRLGRVPLDLVTAHPRMSPLSSSAGPETAEGNGLNNAFRLYPAGAPFVVGERLAHSPPPPTPASSAGHATAGAEPSP